MTHVRRPSKIILASSVALLAFGFSTPVSSATKPIDWTNPGSYAPGVAPIAFEENKRPSNTLKNKFGRTVEKICKNRGRTNKACAAAGMAAGGIGLVGVVSDGWGTINGDPQATWSLAGAAAGCVGGGVLGSFVPIVGTVAGCVYGAFAGSVVGSFLGPDYDVTEDGSIRIEDGFLTGEEVLAYETEPGNVFPSVNISLTDEHQIKLAGYDYLSTFPCTYTGLTGYKMCMLVPMIMTRSGQASSPAGTEVGYKTSSGISNNVNPVYYVTTFHPSTMLVGGGTTNTVDNHRYVGCLGATGSAACWTVVIPGATGTGRLPSAISRAGATTGATFPILAYSPETYPTPDVVPHIRVRPPKLLPLEAAAFEQLMFAEAFSKGISNELTAALLNAAWLKAGTTALDGAYDTPITQEEVQLVFNEEPELRPLLSDFVKPIASPTAPGGTEAVPAPEPQLVQQVGSNTGTNTNTNTIQRTREEADEDLDGLTGDVGNPIQPFITFAAGPFAPFINPIVNEAPEGQCPVFDFSLWDWVKDMLPISQDQYTEALASTHTGEDDTSVMCDFLDDNYTAFQLMSLLALGVFSWFRFFRN